MITTITVKFTSKIQAAQFTPVEQGDELTIQIDYLDEADLEAKIEKWEDFIQKKVVNATFRGANKLLEMKKEIESN